MKTIPFICIGTALTSLLVGCASTPVAIAPVGPNPEQIQTTASTGQLEVFSAMVGRTEGNNPTWYQHTDYYLYDQRGDELKHVDNAVGHYATAPRLINLPPGQYLVKAQAKNYLWVRVPVVVAAGRTTRVHLDANWQAPDNSVKNEVVSIPDGYPVGWNPAFAGQ